MISLQSVAAAEELVELAREIVRVECVSLRVALSRACHELPSVTADIQADARWVPSRVVLFDGDGRPHRVPNLLTARELMEFTERD